MRTVPCRKVFREKDVLNIVTNLLAYKKTLNQTKEDQILETNGFEDHTDSLRSPLICGSCFRVYDFSEMLIPARARLMQLSELWPPVGCNR